VRIASDCFKTGIKPEQKNTPDLLKQILQAKIMLLRKEALKSNKTGIKHRTSTAQAFSLNTFDLKQKKRLITNRFFIMMKSPN
jgi:hypothetical protein